MDIHIALSVPLNRPHTMLQLVLIQIQKYIRHKSGYLFFFLCSVGLSVQQDKSVALSSVPMIKDRLLT